MTTTLNRPATRAGHQAVPKRKDRGGPWLSLLAWVVGILFVLPVVWMVLTSFHSEADAATNPPAVLAPLTLEGYREFFSGGASPWPPLLNSLTASVISTLLVLLLSFPAAYALSIKPVKKWTDVPGGDSINLPLSRNRAQAVANYLAGRGVQPARIATQGFGSSQPLAGNDNSTEAERAANRRVEIRIVPVEQANT
jgi:hypothetical protein